ncbi:MULTISPECIES: PEP-CTERM sorting domain-containing protein [unclassified Lentimonas]|uniref:PEP-CTERM sorting domain-containing protein n=1 Tax=unclassified Lentimonas TaxID=2630993 RepID=UPI0013240DA0|nr:MULTISPECIES: PEP-CTERM sorting domain-containing protein [unclassified Lentimonas]CAA6677714.1 Unannotated [Lentimonas sp. CC4]CAA6684977.1 Unannotated [Lentimonas sp. CC6]CAA7077908.1 Unannotated [Lentimonas sp. CC4]CAA7169832.1 Unannotated [Lentimonas sp. CC21]CAA7179951.1 Unannotated [Lentimonas sp. CC8]
MLQTPDKLTLALACAVVLPCFSHAATYTWISSGGVGQDGDWTNTANWSGGTVPVDRIAGTGSNNGLSFNNTDTVIFDGTTAPTTASFPGLGGTTGGNGDTPTMVFNSGGPFTFDFNGRESSLWSNTAGTRTVFTVGDGTGGGTEDVTLNLTGLTFISRHATGATNNFLVNSDGTLNFNAGVDFRYGTTTDRLATITIAGGDVSFAGGLTNFTDNTGTYVDFTIVGGSFSALYSSTAGGGYVDKDAVETALTAGTNWKNNFGGTFEVTESGGGFTVTAVPEPSSYALLAGLLGMSYVMVRRRK